MSPYVRLTRRQFQLKNKLELTMEVWRRHKWFIYWVTLTSPVESEQKLSLMLAYNRLIARMLRKYGMRPEYCRIETSEGNGVLHCFWAFPKALPRIYDWLKENWLELRGAWNVWIEAVGGKGNDAARVAQYAITQYAINQADGKGGTTIVRVNFSRCSLLPYSISRYLADVRKFLRSELYRWTPWHVTYRMIMDCARGLLVSGSYEIDTEHTLIFSEFTGYEIQLL